MSTVTPIRPLATTATCTSPEASKVTVNAINAALNGTSTDQARMLLTCALFQFEEGHLKIITTNSYRANRVRIFMPDATPSTPFIISGPQLKSALPKASAFKKHGTDRLTLAWYPGKRELDSGQFHVTWGNEQRIVRADPDGGGGGTYPTAESLIDSAIGDEATTTEPVCYNPAFLADIAKDAKLINKERFVKVTPGSSPMKPALFTTKNIDHGINYECLLMPVRES